MTITITKLNNVIFWRYGKTSYLTTNSQGQEILYFFSRLENDNRLLEYQ